MPRCLRSLIMSETVSGGKASAAASRSRSISVSDSDSPSAISSSAESSSESIDWYEASAGGKAAAACAADEFVAPFIVDGTWVDVDVDAAIALPLLLPTTTRSAEVDLWKALPPIEIVAIPSRDGVTS